MSLPRATVYSMCVAGVIMGAPRRGIVHSAFASAANLVFPGDIVISLNANVHPPDIAPRFSPFPGMPNGIQVNGFPFAALRPGMPVLIGAGRLVIDAIDCSLDLSGCTQWDARIARPANLDVGMVQRNAAWLERDYLAQTSDQHSMYSDTFGSVETKESVAKMARALCGRGRGLTPAGDDMLAGWMAIKWLLYGPPLSIEIGPCGGGIYDARIDHKQAQSIASPHSSNAFDISLLTACEEIMAVARQQTHLLSQCWLGYAAQGCVALPVRALLAVMTGNDERQLAAAAQVVASMGATSGCDLMRGMVMGI